MTICAHLVQACKLFDREINGYKMNRNYVYRTKRGPKPKANHAAIYLISEDNLSLASQSSETQSSEINGQLSVIQVPLVERQYSESIISSGDMNDIVTVNKRKKGRPPLTENEKAARL